MNKISIHVIVNTLLAFILGWYFSEIGDNLEQYLGFQWFKMNVSEYIYSILQKKNKFFYNFQKGQIWKNPNWWYLQDLFKGEKSSLKYLLLKNKILNQNILNEMKQVNSNKFFSKDLKIQTTDLSVLNEPDNKIFVDHSNVFYNQEMFDKQLKLLKNINFAKYKINKNFKLYLWNMHGYTGAKLLPKVLPKGRFHPDIVYFLKKVIYKKMLQYLI